MTIQLHDKAKEAIVRHLVEGLPRIQVRNGKYPENFGLFISAYFADQALPSGDIRTQWESYIDELPLVQFTTDYIKRELSENGKWVEAEGLTPLFDLGVFSNPENLAVEIVEKFCTIPWQFRLALPLHDRLFPDDFLMDREYPLGDGQVSTPNLFSEAKFPLSHDNEDRALRAKSGGLLRIGNAEWNAHLPHFVTHEEGLIQIDGGGERVEAATYRLESVIGLGLALRLFHYRFQHDTPPNRPSWFVHKAKQDNWEFWTRFDLNEDTAETLRHISTFKFEDKYPEDRRRPWLQSAIAKIDEVLRHPQSNSVVLAAKWLFDSHKKSDHALTYVRLMTVLEILLGGEFDHSRASLSEIISNRLAYLVGKNYDERSKILSEFKEIYSRRSRIVHRGKHRLKTPEMVMMNRLRSLCEKAIYEEANALVA